MGTKKWYQSKAVWAGVFAVVVSVWNCVVVSVAANFGVNLPVVPDAILGLAGLVGIHGRITATTVIK